MKTAMRDHLVRVVLCMASVFCSGVAMAQTIPQVEKKRVEINEKIEWLTSSYADVPPSYSCKAPQLAYDKIICANKDMQLLEKLYRMASVYAYENATHIETNHKTFRYDRNPSRNKLKTQESVLSYFIQNINDSLGGESPFDVAPQTDKNLFASAIRRKEAGRSAIEGDHGRK